MIQVSLGQMRTQVAMKNMFSGSMLQTVKLWILSQPQQQVSTVWSNDGGVIAAGYQMMYYFMPDFDGDSVGTGDNCPDNYNPEQLDYNGDGAGDACDEDDDSDGVDDVVDSCPRGVKGWTSTDMTDYDGDGCKDLDEEDLDDDGDGVPDITDACPVGIGGAGYDLDGDGCRALKTQMMTVTKFVMNRICVLRVKSIGLLVR